MEIENNATAGNGHDESLGPSAEKLPEVESTEILSKDEQKKEVETSIKDIKEKEGEQSNTGSELKNNEEKEKKVCPSEEVRKPEESNNDEKIEKKDDKVEKKENINYKEESTSKEKSVEKKEEEKEEKKRPEEREVKKELRKVKGSEKEEKKEQRKEKVNEKEQKKEKASEKEQRKDKISEKEQRKDKISEKEQRKDKVSEKEQRKDKVSEKEQRKDKISEKEQRKDRVSEKEQRKDKVSEKEQRKDKVSEKEQSKDKVSEKEEKKEQKKDKITEKEHRKEKVDKKESKVEKKESTKEKKEEAKEKVEKKEDSREKVEKKETKEKDEKIETKVEEKVEKKEDTKEKDKKLKKNEKAKDEKVEKKAMAKNHVIDEEKDIALEKNIKDSSTSHEKETLVEVKIEKDVINTDESLKEKDKQIESPKSEPMDVDIPQDDISNEKEPIIEEPDPKSPEKMDDTSNDVDLEIKLQETTEDDLTDQQVPVVDRYTVEEPPSPNETDKVDNLNNNSEELIQSDKNISTITDDFEGFAKSEDAPKALSILKNLISQVEAEIAQNIFGEESEAELDNLEEIKNLEANLLSTSVNDSPDSAKKSKGKPSYHLQKNPQFKLPFELGWKREVIFRRIVNDYRIKKSCEVLYITPEGDRLLSSLEVLDHLRTKNISTFTSNNFSFLKAPLGILDPEKEIIRRVKETTSRKKANSKTGKIATKVTTSPKGTNSNEDNTSNKAKGFPKIKVAPPKLVKVSTPKATPPKAATPKSSKIKTSVAKKQKRSDGPSASLEPELEQITPHWNSAEKTSPQRTKESTEQPPTAKRKLIEESTPPPSKRLRLEERFTEHFMSNMCLGYSGLLHVFQYLKVQDLLCAGRVCRLWRDLANHHSLWRTVRMKNSKVADWSGLAECLRRHRTRHLDLRKMLIPVAVSSNDPESMWTDFQNAIGRADALTRLDLCRCPAVVVQSLGASSPGLITLNALAIKCSSINLQPLNQLVNLQELRLKSVGGFELKGSLDCFKELTSLKVLSLTTITNLGTSGLEHLVHLTNLESLDLGECCHFPQDFGPSILAKLVKLERLRLEKGQGADCPTFQILAGVQQLTKLTTLELINFDIKPGFDLALAACTNIRRILVIPTYITQSATTNHMLLSGVMKLSNTLHTFVWGVTNELLKVTELFVDQCDGGRQKGKKSDKKLGDSIPVLKPVPGSHLVNQDDEDILASAAPPPVPAASGAEGAAAAANAQVEILPLSKLQKILLACFPNTRVKILKVPYNSTWRQTIAEPNI